MNELNEVFSVRDKVILITGAGRGIGRGIVRVLAGAGAKVAVNSLTSTAAGPLVEEINEQGGEALLVLGDLTRSQEAEQVIEKTVRHFGRLDVLINDLGDSISGSIAGKENKPSLSDEDWRSIMDINLTHMFYCCRAAGKLMLKQGHGKVINISSTGAVAGGGSTAYATAKAGVIGLTRALALEWSPHICVNAIAPGSFPDDEDLSADALQKRNEAAQKSIPLGRVGKPREIGYLALYLASAASDYMTGQTIFLDGGRTAK